MEKIKGGITAPQGFLANSLNCGIKRYKHDLALLFSEVPAVSFALFTQNRVKAAPIIVSQRHVRGGICKAIIVNSGNANCCTGAKGIDDAMKMTSSIAEALNISKKKILVASTGMIGKPLPVEKIEAAVPDLIRKLDKKRGKAFAKTIMTTDKLVKETAVKVQIGDSTVVIGGAAKGAGMINPRMATTLSFITTDAVIRRDALQAAFKEAVDKSFNSISVDGAMSTNDCSFILANGLAMNRSISKDSSAYSIFYTALSYVMSELAKKIILDGEGATKLVNIVVKNAKSYKDAKRIASAVANNTLFKTSIYGEDPNWGRIAAAVGASGVNIRSDKLDIYLGDKRVLKNGARMDIDRESLKKIYRRKRIRIVIDLKSGDKNSRVLTCDLTKAYIDINAGYTT